MNNLEDLPLTTIPILVDLLSPMDVLKLRAVSKDLQSKVEFTRKQLQERLKYKPLMFADFEEFINFNSKVDFLPLSNFSFLFDPLDYLETTEMKEFLGKFGPIISKINMPSVFLFMSEKQIQFFEMMPNLKELAVDRIKLWKSGYEIMLSGDAANKNLALGKGPVPAMTYPESLMNLEKFAFEDACDGPMVSMFIHGLLNLSVLSMGCVDRPNTLNEMTNPEKGNCDLIAATRYLRHKFENQRPLRYLSLPTGIEDAEDITDPVLVEFVKMVSKNAVLLQLVPQIFAIQVLESKNLSYEEKQAFFDLILQMEGMCPVLSSVRFSSLQTLTLSLSNYELSEGFDDEYGPSNTANWSNIQNIFINIRLNGEDFQEQRQRLQNLWSFVFGCQRPSVQQTEVKCNIEDPDVRAVMDPMLIVHNMEGLKSVCLNLPYYDDLPLLLHCLAENAPGISHLEIKVYGVATSDIFIGPNPDQPTILRMENLRHLKIEHDLSPTVAEGPVDDGDCMRDVFPKTSLTCLVILQMSRSSIFRKNAERAQAFLKGKIAKTLRSLTWTSEDDDSVAVFQELKAKVTSNFNAVTSIIHPGLRCRICENYENDSSADKKWFQFYQIM